MKILVCIMHYNRPTLLARLLEDLSRERDSGVDLDVHVFDDHSSLPLPQLPDFVQLTVARANHGKRRFRDWVSKAYRVVEQKRSGYDRFCFMPDDIRLCERFFHRLEAQWLRLKKKTRGPRWSVPGLRPRLACLTYMVDVAMDGRPSWTAFGPVREGPVTRTQWVDGAFYCESHYFEALGWRVPGISWRQSPEFGSGLGAAISCALHRQNGLMYHVHESLACRVYSASLMNPYARRETPLMTARFVDGTDAQRRLSVTSPVVCALASVPSRVATLARAVASLRPQCDELCVYLNGYDQVPEFLGDVTVARSQDHGDRGDAGKFFWATQRSDEAYYLSCDDDIVYPPDYVAQLVERVEAYGRRAVVSFHGAVLPEGFRGYYRSRKAFHCRHKLAEDKEVHVPGTGVMGFWLPTLRLKEEDFVVRNGADVNVAVAAKRASVPVVVARHRAEWIKVMDVPWDIYSMRHEKDPELTAHLRTAFGKRVSLTGVRYGAVWQGRPAAFWDQMWKTREGTELTERIVSMCMEADSIVEIGCGYGHFAKTLLKRGWRGSKYLGIDVSAGPLAMNDLDPKVVAIQAEFMSLVAGPVEDPRLQVLAEMDADIIVSQAVLCHQAHWLPMVLAAKKHAKRLAMDVSYVSDELLHRPTLRKDGCYDTYTSIHHLRQEIAALDLPITVERIRNQKRNCDELLLVM